MTTIETAFRTMDETLTVSGPGTWFVDLGTMRSPSFTSREGATAWMRAYRVRGRVVRES